MKKTVLIVDDNDDLRHLLADTLSLDYNVVTAEHGERAIEILTETAVDLVIMDVEMPVTNGFEALRIVRDDANGWPELPVVMLTVRKEPENALKAWGIGADFYMTKPFSPTELLTLAHQILQEDAILQ